MKDIFYPVAHRPQEQIDSFKTRYEDFDAAVIPGLVQAAVGLRPQTVARSTSWGSAHIIYILSFNEHPDLVFRANISMPEPEVVMVSEKLITDRLQAAGLPTNIVLYVDVSRSIYPFDYQIEEKLGGVDPENEFEGTEDEYTQFTFETGQAVAKMQTVTLDGFGRFDEASTLQGELRGTKTTLYEYLTVCLAEDLDLLGQKEFLSSAQAAGAMRFFEDRQSIINIQQGSLVHYDLADHNLRYQNGHLVGIFDWETAVIASPVLDLASCPTWKSHFPKRQKLLEGYRSICALPDNFDELEKVFLLRTMLWKLPYAIRIGIITDARKTLFYEVLDNCLRT